MVKHTHRGVKTTVEIPEEIWRAANVRSLDDHSSLRAVIIAALETYLGLRPKKGAKRAR